MTAIRATPTGPPASPAVPVDPHALVERFGSPLFVYDLAAVASRFARLRAAFPSRVEIAYAVKANPSLGVLAHLAGLGVGADIASAGELAAVRRVGFRPERVVMTGPGKRDDELREAVQAGIRAITVESTTELDRLEAIARANSRARPVPVMLRSSSRPTPGSETRPVIRGSVGKFGMDREDLLRAAARAHRSAALELVGIHSFGASNVLDADALVEHARAATALARDIAAAVRSPLRLVDIGGGLGIPYERNERELDVERLGTGLARLTGDWDRDRWLSAARLLVEPGRYLVGPAGRYLTRVIDRKVVDGEIVIVLDGGIHHLLRPALVGQPHAVEVAGPRESREPGPLRRVSLVGPLCTGLDVLGQDVTLPELHPGDLVAIRDTGAYGFTESMPLFLSHPSPAEVAVRGGEVALLRPRIEPSELLDRQLLPSWSAIPAAADA